MHTVPAQLIHLIKPCILYLLNFVDVASFSVGSSGGDGESESERLSAVDDLTGSLYRKMVTGLSIELHK